MLTAEYMSCASVSHSVLFCQGPSDLGVPEGAGVSGQDGMWLWLFLSEVSQSVSLTFKKQSEHDGELLLCVPVLRWIFKDVHIQRTLRTKFLHFCWHLSMLASMSKFQRFSSVLLSPFVPSQWGGKRKECLKNFSSGATPNYNFPGLLDFRKENALKATWLQIHRWLSIALVTG